MFKILIISSVYDGYLEKFHSDKANHISHSYQEMYDRLMSDSTEFVASYVRTLRTKGVNANAVIANDSVLKRKWTEEYGDNAENILFSQVRHYSPDIVWVEDLRFTDEDFLSQLKLKFPFIRLLIAYHCAPVTPGSFSKFLNFDFILTCTPGLKEEFESKGLRCYLVYHGFDTGLLPALSSTSKNKSDVLFSGTLKQGKGYHLERIMLIDYLISNGLNISLFINLENVKTLNFKKILRFIYKSLKTFGVTNPEKISRYLEYGAEPVISYPKSILKNYSNPLFGYEMLALLAGSKIVLNNHGQVAGQFAGNMRLFEATGAGSCLVTDNKSNIKDLFEPGTEIIVYDDNQDCLKKITWLLQNDDERIKIARAGQQRTLKDHTVSRRCDTIINILTQELSANPN
jgi:spore maturation protein CgeB